MRIFMMSAKSLGFSFGQKKNKAKPKRFCLALSLEIRNGLSRPALTYSSTVTFTFEKIFLTLKNLDSTLSQSQKNGLLIKFAITVALVGISTIVLNLTTNKLSEFKREIGFYKSPL